MSLINKHIQLFFLNESDLEGDSCLLVRHYKTVHIRDEGKDEYLLARLSALNPFKAHLETTFVTKDKFRNENRLSYEWSSKDLALSVMMLVDNDESSESVGRRIQESIAHWKECAQKEKDKLSKLISNPVRYNIANQDDNDEQK